MDAALSGDDTSRERLNAKGSVLTYSTILLSRHGT